MDFEEIYYTCRDNPEKYDRKMGKYVSKSYRTEGVSDIAHAVKSDNPDTLKKWIAINKIAKHIIDQNILTSKDYIVPAPQHTGRAEYTLDIAKIISDKTGCKIADILGCKPRDTLYNLKKKNGEKSIKDSGLYLLTDNFPKYNIWFLDNVTATGKTFEDARKLIPHLKPLIYSISPRLKIKMKNRKTYFIRESKEQKTYLEILKDMLPFETEWEYDDDAGDFLVDINNPKRFVIQYGEEYKHKGEFIVNKRITKGDSWTWSTRFFKTIPEAINYLKIRLNESRTYFGDEIKDVVDWLIESPYNNWQEEDREYLMNCDNEKLFKYESDTIDTIDLEDALNGLYESNNRSKNMKIKESKTFEEKIDAFISRIEEYKEICENTYMPNYWKVSYSKVPEGLKLTIDTDSWFDESYQLGHLIDFILDVYGASYDDSTYELTGINVHSDVEFLGGKKSDWATYLIKDNEKFEESRIEESFKSILQECLPTAAERKAKMDAVKSMSLDELIEKYMPDSFINDDGELELYKKLSKDFPECKYRYLFSRTGITFTYTHLYWPDGETQYIIKDEVYKWRPGDPEGSHSDFDKIATSSKIPRYVLKLIFEKFNAEMRMSESKIKESFEKVLNENLI